jgi:hypothetical protein
MASDDQRTNYEKHSKVESTGHLEPMKGGASNSGNTGPTGSARTYAKGKSTHHNTDWNPQKCSPSTYGVNGV